MSAMKQKIKEKPNEMSNNRGWGEFNSRMKMTEETVNFKRAQTEMIKSEQQKNDFLKRKKASGSWQSKRKF